jgi:LacI family transcriptional regulator
VAGIETSDMASRPRGRSQREAAGDNDEVAQARPGYATLATLYDVARVAGVSTATVSRVVHGHDGVRASTRQRVLEAIEALRYVPDGAAQSLSRRRKEVIGLVSVERLGPESQLDEMNLLFFDEVLRGVEASLREVGWSLLISFLQSGEQAYRRLQSMSGKLDGLLIAEGIIEPQQLARLAARLPIVLIAGSPAEPDVDVVAADNRSGTVALVAHLVEVHGCRRLYYVAGPAEAPDARERRAAFEHALADYPQATISGFFEGRFSSQSGEEAGRQILASSSGGLPDAVVCGNDLMAIGVIRAFGAGGVRVPGDMAVVGFDDVYAGALFEPPLTTVRQAMRLLGELASSRLLQRIKDPELPHSVELLPTELVLRASCGCTNRDAARTAPPAAGSLPAKHEDAASEPVTVTS